MTRPVVTVMCSASLDGKLAPAGATSSRPFLSEVPDRFAAELDDLRQAVDGVAVGNRTIVHDDSRLLPSSGEPRLRVVIDPEGRLSADDAVLADDHPTAVAVTADTDLEYRDRLDEHPAKDAISMGAEPDLDALLAALSGRGIDHLLLEGGGRLIYHFLDGGLVDELRLLYLPVFVGDATAASLCDGRESLFPDVRLDVTRREMAGDHTLVEGRVEYDGDGGTA